VTTETGLRRALLAGCALALIGTVAELAIARHTGSLVQWLPFLLTGAMLPALIAFARWRGGWTRRLLRTAAVVLLLGGAFGVFEHLEHNAAFEAEIRPEAPSHEVWWEAVFGASPLLAPGIFGVAGLLAAAATWRHRGL